MAFDLKQLRLPDLLQFASQDEGSRVAVGLELLRRAERKAVKKAEKNG